MRITLIHNTYGRFSGEEAVVQSVVELLRERRWEVVEFFRSSEEIPRMRFGKLWALLCGVHSRSSCRAVRRMLREERPDVVNVHNVYPLISPSVLRVCREAGVPVVMTVHNYRLVCPNGLHMSRGQICEKCCGGREYWCVLKNCERSLSKSLGYALRNWAARKRRAFLDNVTMYVALTEFQRQRLIREGFPAERIVVVPNMAEVNHDHGRWTLGEYVGFVGRISPEKGIATLCEAARSMPDLPMRAAGSCEGNEDLTAAAPANVEFLGQLDHNRLDSFYACSRMIVLPSVWYEGFPLILPEAMLHGKPVICSRIGGLPEIVDDRKTGLLVEPGNAGELAQKIRYLWERPDLCRRMGQAGREKALREYSPDKFYERLMAVYEKAIALGPGGPSGCCAYRNGITQLDTREL